MSSRSQHATRYHRPAQFLDQPLDVTFIRHGKSSGNLAKQLQYEGKLTPEKLNELKQLLRVDWDIPLVEDGYAEAKTIGKALITDSIFDIKTIDVVLVSNYRRTRETAHGVLTALGFHPHRKIELNPTVGERDWGELYLIDDIQQQKGSDLRKQDPFCWAPEAGESIRSTRERVQHLFSTLNRRFGGKRVLIFSHGEFILSAMAEITRTYDQEQFGKMLERGMPNCGVVQFSRLSETGHESRYYSHMRQFAVNADPRYGDWGGELKPIVLPEYNLRNLLLGPSERSNQILQLLGNKGAPNKLKLDDACEIGDLKSS